MTYTTRNTQTHICAEHLASNSITRRHNGFVHSLLLLLACVILVGCGPNPKEKPPQPTFKIDHYKFYNLKTNSMLEDVPVKLMDQFHEQQVLSGTVAEPKFFGNPVIKTKKGDHPGAMKNPLAHLTWYALDDTPSEPKRTLELTNQFGTQTVTIGSASILLAPALKSKKGKEVDKNSQLPNSISHYVGYIILNKVIPHRGPLKLKDQFITDTHARVRQAAFLFVPADKIRDGEFTERVHAEDHLLAFQLERAEVPENTKRQTRDQFNILDVDFKFPQYLAVPTKKKVLN